MGDIWNRKGCGAMITERRIAAVGRDIWKARLFFSYLLQWEQIASIFLAQHKAARPCPCLSL